MKNRKELLLAFIYTSIMVMAMSISYKCYGYTYANPRIVLVLFYFEILMSLFALVIYFLYYPFSLSFGKIKFNIFIVIYISLVCVVSVIFFKEKFYLENKSIIYMTFATNILVGFSEELMYRGVILQGYLANNSKLKSVIMSSLLFSLLHVANLFSAISIQDLTMQLLNTFAYGIFASCIALKTCSILPLIIIHGLWDNFVNSQTFVQQYSLLFLIVILYEIVIGIILLINLIKERHNHNKEFA